MKKQEKIDLIKTGVNDTVICKCCFTYDKNSFYYYPHAVNDKFILGQVEDEFLLDGYCIRKISHLKKVEAKNDKCDEINKIFGVADNIKKPDIDINSWQSIFNDLKALNVFIEIEDEFNGQFAIGVIEKVTKNKLYFKSFDADGLWDEIPLEIPFSEITSVKWGNRYANYWQMYMEKLMNE